MRKISLLGSAILMAFSVSCYADENQPMELQNTSTQSSTTLLEQPATNSNDTLVANTPVVAPTMQKESQDFVSAWGVAIQAGTLGIGVNLAHALYSDYLDIRGQYNFLPIGSQNIAGNSMDFNFNTLGLLLDYKPFGGVFRFTGGLYYDGRKISTSGNNIDIDGSSASGSTGINFPTIAPYLGIGVGSYGASTVDKKGFLIAFDAGVLFSKANAYANVQCNAASGSDCSNFDANKQTYLNQLNDAFAAFPYYPVVSLGLGYRF